MIRPITLLTDFGNQDVFVGVLKGVILSINPWASITDLGHGVPPQDIHAGAFHLSIAHGYFPRGTIFCTVVDPGVGSDRRAVAIETERYFFVGPDNGVLYPAARADRVKKAVALERPEFFLKNISSTFHGRDIFAPVAAHLSLSRDLEDLGPKMAVSELTPLSFPEPRPTDQGLELTILHVDTYGNLTLNLKIRDFHKRCGKGFCLRAGSRTITQAHPAYAHAPDQQPVLLESSSGYMEIAVKNQSAARILGLSAFDTLVLE